MAQNLSTLGARLYAQMQLDIAETYGVELATKMFSVEPTIAQELNEAITAKSDFLQRINIIPVGEVKGQKVFLGVSGPVTGRTDTKTKDREAKDGSALDDSTYELFSTESDVCLPYAKIDAWAKFPDFAQKYSAAVQKQIALDRIMVGFHGVSAAAQTDLAANPVLMYVLIWLFDTAEFEQAFELADFAMSQEQVLPAPFKRDIPTFVADELIDWAEIEYKAGRSAEPYVSNLLPRVDGEWKLFEKIPARYHKLLGILAMDQKNWAKAIEHFNRAMDLDDKIGVLTRLNGCIGALNKLAAAAANQSTD